MVQLLSCTASTFGKNAAEMEKLYQEQKQLRQKLKEVQGQLTKASTHAFSDPRERFVDVKASAASQPQQSRKRPRQEHLPPGIQRPRQGLAGMQARNPDLWAQMTQGSASRGGMGWFSETNLVGKEYDEQRKTNPWQL
jgi:hypothetical protein